LLACIVARQSVSTLRTPPLKCLLSAAKLQGYTGGLMSCRARFVSAWRQSGIYVARILNAEKPANMAVLRPNQVRV